MQMISFCLSRKCSLVTKDPFQTVRLSTLSLQQTVFSLEWEKMKSRDFQGIVTSFARKCLLLTLRVRPSLSRTSSLSSHSSGTPWTREKTLNRPQSPGLLRLSLREFRPKWRDSHPTTTTTMSMATANPMRISSQTTMSKTRTSSSLVTITMTKHQTDPKVLPFSNKLWQILLPRGRAGHGRISVIIYHYITDPPHPSQCSRQPGGRRGPRGRHLPQQRWWRTVRWPRPGPRRPRLRRQPRSSGHITG